MRLRTALAITMAKPLFIIATLTSVVPSIMPVIAQAQSAGALEEIFVTATRRGETDIQTTPIAVTAVSSADFDKLFAQDIGEIATYVPNFSAATVTGFNAASFAMRGAAETDIIVYFDPKVGVLVDDFVVPHVQTQLLEPFDIETIEVLRGPQGTLFGKNTTAGAVVVRTRRPVLDQRSVEASVQYGSFNDIKTRFAGNLSLNDSFAIRIAGIYQSNDGYYRNGKVDQPTNAFGGAVGDALARSGSTLTGDGRDLGGKDIFSGRFKALWQPMEGLSILGQYEIIRDSSDPVPVVNTTPARSRQLAETFGFPGITAADGDPLDRAGLHQSAITGLDGNQRVHVDGGYLNVEWDLGQHTLYALAGYRYQESRLPNEYLGTTYDSFFSATRDDDRETLQLEARIASNDLQKLNYVAGVFYQQNDAEFCVLQQLGLLEFFGTGTGGAVVGTLDNANPLILCNQQDATAWAVFGDMVVDVNDRLSIGGGVRWTDEKKDYVARQGTPVTLFPDPQAIIANPLAGADFSLVSAGVETDANDWGELTWRATLSWQFNADLFAYFTASRGFKSGGYNDQAGSGTFAQFPVSSYDPEFANNREVGLKATLLDGRLLTSLTYFHVTYDDFQRSRVVAVPNTAFQETRTFNAGKLKAQGIEFEGTMQLTEGLTLRANLGWLDSKYREFLLDQDNNPATPPDDFSDRTPTRSPEFTGGLDLTYLYPLAGGDVRLNYNFSYEKENTYYYADSARFDTVLEERTISNISATWTDAADRFYISAFAKNLSDDRYQTAAQYVASLWTFSNYGPPRSFGVQVGGKFDF